MSTGLRMTQAQETAVCETYKSEGRAAALGVMQAFFNHTKAESLQYDYALDGVLASHKLIKEVEEEKTDEVKTVKELKAELKELEKSLKAAEKKEAKEKEDKKKKAEAKKTAK